VTTSVVYETLAVPLIEVPLIEVALIEVALADEEVAFDHTPVPLAEDVPRLPEGVGETLDEELVELEPVDEPFLIKVT
jgi:hypothetical protein